MQGPEPVNFTKNVPGRGTLSPALCQNCKKAAAEKRGAARTCHIRRRGLDRERTPCYIGENREKAWKRKQTGKALQRAAAIGWERRGAEPGDCTPLEPPGQQDPLSKPGRDLPLLRTRAAWQNGFCHASRVEPWNALALHPWKSSGGGAHLFCPKPPAM